MIVNAQDRDYLIPLCIYNPSWIPAHFVLTFSQELLRQIGVVSIYSKTLIQNKGHQRLKLYKQLCSEDLTESWQESSGTQFQNEVFFSFNICYNAWSQTMKHKVLNAKDILKGFILTIKRRITEDQGLFLIGHPPARSSASRASALVAQPLSSLPMAACGWDPATLSSVQT